MFRQLTIATEWAGLKPGYLVTSVAEHPCSFTNVEGRQPSDGEAVS